LRRTASISSRATLLVASLLLAGCRPAVPAAPSPDTAARQIQAMLDASAEAWTRGDLDGFLDDYADDAVLVGSRVRRGRDAIGEAYRSGYWSGGAPEDGLRFRIMDTRLIGTEAAVVLGRYELFARDTGAVSSTGIFSLTMERDGETWKIVHDHTTDDGG
jgi:uncharacterized protein (TIGR02246 family)